MKVNDLYETIETWIHIYKNITRPDIENKVNNEYSRGMLKVISALRIIEEIKNTTAEKYLSKAIEEAKSGDFTKLDEIYIYLNEAIKGLK
jgi:DNA-binding transcriptional regulator YhcF (GntR family)